MANSVYIINKGINRSIEFRGLKAQYILYLGAGLLGLMFIYAMLYVAGVSVWLNIPIVAVAGAILFVKVYAMSNTYGQYGLMKLMARRMVPKVVSSRSRTMFINLKLQP